MGTRTSLNDTSGVRSPVHCAPGLTNTLHKLLTLSYTATPDGRHETFWTEETGETRRDGGEDGRGSEDLSRHDLAVHEGFEELFRSDVVCSFLFGQPRRKRIGLGKDEEDVLVPPWVAGEEDTTTYCRCFRVLVRLQVQV